MLQDIIAIVIVLYNDDVPAYVYKIKECPIYLVDNTPSRNLKIGQPGITYLALNENKGIATALNIGINKATVDGASWVITMDQDSIIPDNMIKEYRKYLGIVSNIGILAPQLLMYEGEIKNVNNSLRNPPTSLKTSILIRLPEVKASFICT